MSKTTASDSTNQAFESNRRAGGDGRSEPIAVIGMGCRFPGGANSPEEFWRLLCSGYDAIVDMPLERWNADAFAAPDIRAYAKSVSRRAGLVDLPIDAFDASFFGVSSREAAWIDPMHRWLLEVTWEAIEDAGMNAHRLAGSKTGVYVGIFTEDAKLKSMMPTSRHLIELHTATGTSMTMASNRLSYWFDFRGPSVSLDTACSSSLVAVHLACQSIWSGDSKLALAGGANAIFMPVNTITESRAGMLSPSGECRTFDSKANGYVRAEGAGIVLLKPLADALADGDPIRAVILGTASNQDGHTVGITVPSGEAQKANVREACRRAGIRPTDVTYIEAHGTGTPVGDPIEARALGEVCGVGRPSEKPLIVGSAKTNVGHLEAAAGIVGLMKAVLSLQHRKIAPHKRLQTPNPAIPFAELGIRVPLTLEDWPADSPALAGVNSFGFGGTNAHVVLGGAPEQRPAPRSNDGIPQLISLSARSRAALEALARSYHDKLVWGEGAPTLADIAGTAGNRRAHHEERVAFVAKSPDDFKGALEEVAAGGTPSQGARGTVVEKASQVWVFSGMGPQWWGMGRELLRTEPVFRAKVEAIDELFRPLAGWSLVDQMTVDESASRMSETQVAQPANFAIQVGVAALFESWGLLPAAIVGHSAGEVAAAYVAGAMSLPEAVRVIYHRSRLQQLSTGQGKLLAVELSREEVERAIQGFEGVSIAALNGPRSATLVGDPAALEQIASACLAQETFARFLKVDVPYHSHYMEPIRQELHDVLADLSLEETTIPLFSTVTGAQIRGTELDAGYWWRNVREPVYFAAAIEQLLSAGFEGAYVEISPHPVLSTSLKQCIEQRESSAFTISTLNRKRADRQAMLECAAHLYVAGCDLNWDAIVGSYTYTPLPHYAWQRQSHWIESDESRADRQLALKNPLLGRRMASPQPTWNNVLSATAPAFLADHRVDRSVVYPGAAYVEMACAAAAELQTDNTHIELTNFVFENAAVLGEEAYQLQTTVDWDQQRLRIDGYQEGLEWKRHARCELRVVHTRDGAARAANVAGPIEIRQSQSVDEWYQRLAEHGLPYGPAFRNLAAIEVSEGRAVAELEAADVIRDTHEFHIHPGLLDTCFQVLFAGAFTSSDASVGTYLPVGVAKVSLAKQRAGGSLRVVATKTRATAAEREGNLEIYDADGELVALLEGVRAVALERRDSTSNSRSLSRAFSRVVWEKVDLTTLPQLDSPTGTYCLFVDQGGVAQRLASELERRGCEVVLVQRAADYRDEGRQVFVDATSSEHSRRLFDKLAASSAPLRGVLYLWGLDAVANTEVTSAALNQSLMIGAAGLVTAAQELSARAKLPLWVITQQAQVVSEQQAPPSLAQAPLWGLSSTMFFQDCRELAGGMIDLPAEIGAHEIETSVTLVRSVSTDDTHFAIRDEQVFVWRIVAAPEYALRGQTTKLRSDRTYIVTGGLGGLGLLCARWLVERGARRLILIGRTPLPPRESWPSFEGDSELGKKVQAITEMEAMGASVHIAKLDVADASALSAYIRDYRQQQYPAIGGVIHCAGALSPAMLNKLDVNQLPAETGAKIAGGWALHEALGQEPLEFFVMFSSMSSFGASMGL